MVDHPIVSRAAWRAARTAFLVKEKALTRMRAELAAERRRLPWVAVEKPYRFVGAGGPVTLSDLFDGKRQLIVQHFMFGPDWDAGCPSCSFMADHVDGALHHLPRRDVAFAAISRAPLEKIEAYRARMGWGFTWVSSADSDFNFDYGVSFTPDQVASGSITYNFEQMDWAMEEMPGISIFCKDAAGEIFHTYSTYARGLENVIGTYDFLDLTPLGRNETSGNGNLGGWVRRHDEYDG